MAITSNFDKDNHDGRKGDKLIVRIPPGQEIGSDTPGLKPVKNGAYLWVMDHRRRSGRSWRELSSVN